jgi:transposase
MAADREPIERKEHGKIGMDPGFQHLLTIAALDGQWEKIEHPRELEATEHRLAQAQRGHNRVLTARLHERGANQLGKSVSSSSHYQLRQMLAYKSRSGGTQYDEPDAKFSTKTCSDCGSLSGPTGWFGLAVRQWRCSDCGSRHDRDVNAARNTLFAGAGIAHEEACHV